MDEYKSNSYKSKEKRKGFVPEEKVRKIITGTAKHKKKNEIQKFAEIFISEDVNNLKSYILIDVLIPTIKKAIRDIVVNGTDTILNGGKSNGTKGFTASKVSYRSYWDKENDRKNYNPPRIKIGYSYDDVILDSRGEAEEVLLRMHELISEYGLVRVADLYDLVGISGSYTDNDYGWTNLRNADVIRLRDGSGYLIKLPKALPLDY